MPPRNPVSPTPRPSANLPTRRWPGLLLLPALLAGCELPDFMSHPVQARGNRVEADQLAQLVPGTSTRGDATALLGSPTAKATFDDNVWIYIAELTKPIIGGTNAIQQQQAVALVFDPRGVLQKVERKTDADAVPIEVVAHATPTPGNELNFLQQLLGNVGRFSPGSVGGGNRPAGTSPGNY